MTISLLVLLLTAMGVVFIICTAEPSYQGQSLSKWLSSFGEINWQPDDPGARAAIEAIGSNAAPFLVKWVAYKQSPLKSNFLYRANAVGKALGVTNRFNDTKIAKADAAVRALGLARPVPDSDLVTLGALICHPDKRVSYRACQAVKYAGGFSLNALFIMMTNSSPKIRKLALIDLGQRPDLSLAVGSVLTRLEDESPEVAEWAAIRLGDIPNPSLSVVPALTRALKHPSAKVRSAAACALGNLGKAASAALPELQGIQKDPNPTVRNSAALALSYIERSATVEAEP